ncbi:SEC14-like protein 2, partial [Stegodyphus mimosarum]
MFNLFKPVFKLTLLEKVQFVDREHTAELLLKHIDEDVLPEFLGGKRRDSKGNPKCSEFLRFGGKIPEEYYLCHRPLLLPSDPGASSVVIGARSCFNYSVVVQKPGSRLSIEFRTEGASIYIIMLYRKFGPDPNVLDIPASDEYLDEKAEKSNVQLVSPGLRVQSHFAPVEDKCTAPWPGIYIFKFDNTSSWFMSKRLIYRIRVLEPEL